MGSPCGEARVSSASAPPLSLPCVCLSVRPSVRPTVLTWLLPKRWIVISTDLSGPPAWMCQCSSLSLGVGDGGEGGGEQAVASIFCVERTRLVSHRSGKALSHCCFLFVHQVTAHRREYSQCVFWNSCLFLDLNIHKPAADLFILTLLV